MKKILFITLIILVSITSFADVNIEKLGEWGTGTYKNITIDSNNNLYCITEVSGIDIYSIENAEQPVKIGILPFNNVESMYFSGNTLFLSRGLNGITIVNIEDLNSPQIISEIAMEGYAYNCVSNGNTLFVASGSKGLSTFDISDISNPSFLKSFTEETNTDGELDIVFTKTVKVKLVDNKIYAADKNTGFAIVNINDPANPTLETSYNSFGGIIDFLLEDTKLYLQKTSGFRIVNIEDLTAITTVSAFSSVKKLTKLYKTGNFILISDSEFGITSVDVETEASPTLIDHFFLGGIASGMVVVGDYAYVSDSYNGLVTVDISDPNSISVVSTINNNGYVRNIEVKGDNIYVADIWNGTRVIDKTNLLSINLLTSIHKNNITNDIEAGTNNYIYTADSDNGISVIDVSTPESSSVVSTLDLDGIALSSKQKDNYLFISSEWNGINIVDLSDPAAPILKANYKGEGYIYNFGFYGNTLITASGIAGIECVDISNPESPVKLSSLSTGGYVFDIVIQGDFAYVLDVFNGLYVVDISNTDFPVIVSEINDLAYSTKIDVKGDYLYLSQGTNGFSIWNIKNPENPVKETTVDTDGNVEFVKADGSNFYVADGNSGKVLVYSFEEVPANRMYIPHIALNDWSTEIKLTNDNLENKNAKCTAFEGESIKFLNKVEIEPEFNYDLNINKGNFGYIDVEENVSGTVSYIQKSTGNSVSLPITNKLYNNFYLDIPEENNSWIGIAIYNNYEDDSQITISLFDKENNLISEVNENINKLTNRVWLLSSLFSKENIDLGSYLKVSGNNQYTGLIISGDNEGNLFGNVATNK